ncbi:unnamed protein product [Prunus brigantina]
MLELWETTDQDASIDLMELGVDKLGISKRFTEPHQEGNKRRILERLDSDVQKLTNLQITVEDLKRKVEITEMSKKGKGIEFENVKGQLEEAEEAITKLPCSPMHGIESGNGSWKAIAFIRSYEPGKRRVANPPTKYSLISTPPDKVLKFSFKRCPPSQSLKNPEHIKSLDVIPPGQPVTMPRNLISWSTIPCRKSML